MTNHLEILRKIIVLSSALKSPSVSYPIDADLLEEAKNDVDLALILQSARRLDQCHAQTEEWVRKLIGEQDPA